MRLKSDLILLFVAAVWGSGFVAQRLAAGQMDTFYFNGGRFLLAALFLLVPALLQKQGDLALGRKQAPWMILAGVLLFAAAGLQQAGLVTTTIGNASFITGLYVVLVPLILFLFLKERITWLSWVAVVVAAVGVGLLSLQGEFRLAPGDTLELIGAVIWALHVILVGRLSSRGVDFLWFSVIQFITCGILSLLLAFVLVPDGFPAMVASWPAVLYSAAIPIGMGFSLQIVGQKHAPAVDAAIILSTEAVFGTLFGFLFLRETLAPQQMLGCLLLFIATLLAQFQPGEKRELSPVPSVPSGTSALQVDQKAVQPDNVPE